MNNINYSGNSIITYSFKISYKTGITLSEKFNRNKVTRVVNLIVDDHVYCTMRLIGRQITQGERLVDDSLARKRGIAMKQDTHHLNRHHNILHYQLDIGYAKFVR